MRILVLYPYAPYPIVRGTFQRTFHLLRELARHNRVDFFALDEDSAAQAHRAVFEQFCARVHLQPFVHPPWPKFRPARLLAPVPVTVRHWHCPHAHAALRAFAAGQEYDLIYFCDLVMFPYAEALPHPCPRVMDRSRVDLLFQTEELRTLPLGWMDRVRRRENLAKIRRFERHVADRIAATVVCGPDDAAFLHRHVRTDAPVLVLPNGCDATFFDATQFPPAPPSAPTWLFCGAMDYSPNVDAMAWYFAEIDPLVRVHLPQRRIRIVGKNPVAAIRAYGDLPGVTVTGEVADVRPHYQSCDFQIVPLRIGGGTRLKIVESLNIGCPVVSTTIGAQGLELDHDQHLLLADDPRRFADAIVRLARNPTLRARLRHAGRERTLDRYAWPLLGRRLHKFFHHLPAPVA